MRRGNVQRRYAWLTARGLSNAARAAARASAHCDRDSINDLPLLHAVGHPAR